MNREIVPKDLVDIILSQFYTIHPIQLIINTPFFKKELYKMKKKKSVKHIGHYGLER